MEKRKMDYQKIIDVCKIIGVVLTILGAIVAIITVWAYFENKKVKSIENEIEEQRKVENEESIKENKVNISNVKDELQD